jgi:hypothetical protein
VLKDQQQQLMRALNVDQYAIRGEEADWDAALQGKAGGAPKSAFLSVKRAKAQGEAPAAAEPPRSDKKAGKDKKQKRDRDE